MKKDLISPRPIFNYDEDPKGKRTVVLGTKYSGIVLQVTKEGIEFNGYYTSADGETKYGVLRDFISVSWADLEQMKQELFRKKKRRLSLEETPDEVDDCPSEEYLSSLPIVTMNGMRFFVDLNRKERRPVANPKFVFKFREAFDSKKEV